MDTPNWEMIAQLAMQQRDAAQKMADNLAIDLTIANSRIEVHEARELGVTVEELRQRRATGQAPPAPPAADCAKMSSNRRARGPADSQ